MFAALGGIANPCRVGCSSSMSKEIPFPFSADLRWLAVAPLVCSHLVTMECKSSSQSAFSQHESVQPAPSRSCCSVNTIRIIVKSSENCIPACVRNASMAVRWPISPATTRRRASERKTPSSNLLRYRTFAASALSGFGGYARARSALALPSSFSFLIRRTC